MGEVKTVPGITEDELRQAVIDQVTALCEPLEPIRPGEVTATQMADAWGRPLASTRQALERQVSKGTMTRRKAISDTGRECIAYRVVEAT